MAPKRRGIAMSSGVPTGKRSVRRAARQQSSSSSSTSSSTPEASPSSTTVDLLAGKVITTGRKVDFNLFHSEGFTIGAQLKEMGWEKICSLDVPTYPALVKEFYSDLSRGEGGLVSMVRGKRIVVTAQSLGNLLEMPTMGVTASMHDDRGGALSRMLGREVGELEEIFANQLNLELRLLHNICGRILFPKIGRFEYVSERDILLMDCIITGQQVNLPGMMISYMAEAATKKRSTLPYGMVLTLVFRSHGVPILEKELQRKLRYTDYYTISTIHRMGFRKIDGIWQRKGQEARTEETRIEDVPEPSTAGPSTAGPSRSHVSPPQEPTRIFTEPAEFSERQLDQLRALLNERDAAFKEDLRQISVRLDYIASTLTESASTLTCEIHNIFERIKGIAEDSKAYMDASGKLRREVDFAIDQVNLIMKDFAKSQRDEFQEVIGHLKRIVYKHA